jgi:hypothetical protein
VTQTAAAGAKPPTKKAVVFGEIPPAGGYRAVLYGCGGSGKTSAAAMAPGPVAFIDLDNSLPILRSQLPDELDIRPVHGVRAWQAIRDALNAPGWEEIKTICLDSATAAEELAVAHVIATVPHEKGMKVTKIGDYPFGLGYRHVYDEFIRLLGDFDQHVRAGRHVILVCHETFEKHPNPQGEDWLRAEPRLQHSPRSSVRERVRDWCDFMGYIAYDIDAANGKARGTGTRTLYPCELPHCMAKSRTVCEAMPLAKNDPSVWAKIIRQ